MIEITSKQSLWCEPLSCNMGEANMRIVVAAILGLFIHPSLR